MPTINVLDSTMYYEDVGAGTPFVFLHGNPTSSYLWRHVLPLIGPPARCLAPDLIGMGRSGKPDVAYRFDDHARYLDAWFDALGLDGVVLVGHDWGGALAFDWATRHPERTLAVAFMETILRPMTWDDFPVRPDPGRVAAHARVGEPKVLDENFFIEVALRATVLSGLGDDDLSVPLALPDSRQPTSTAAVATGVPDRGPPGGRRSPVEAYDQWLANSEHVPKLLLTFAGPAELLLIGPADIAWSEANIANLEIVECGPAAHVAPEDQPAAIAAAIAEWADRHDLRSHHARAP